MKHAFRLLGLFAIPLALSACSGLKEDLGLGRNPPDEFAVVDRPPLSMPPDFTLRPPQPGAPRPQETDPSVQASVALFSSQHNYVGSASASENALLTATNADKADPSIRNTVDREAAQRVVTSEHLVEHLLSWTGLQDNSTATTVNATAEAERIQTAKDRGEAINSTPTPIIERSKTGWLGL